MEFHVGVSWTHKSDFLQKLGVPPSYDPYMKLHTVIVSCLILR